MDTVISDILKKGEITSEQLQQVREELDKLSRLEMDEINRDDLVDIRDVDIDVEEPIETRMLKYLEQIKNPYVFKVGDIVVRLGFNENGKTLDEIFEDHLRSNL